MRHDPGPLLRSVSLIVLALSACTSAGGVPPGSGPPAAQGSAPAPGQIVAGIDPRIWCIHQDRNGGYWFGSNGNGLYRYDGQRVIHYTEADGLNGDQVRDIEEDTEGNVLISTTDGVSRFDGTRLTPVELVEAPVTGEGWVLDPDDVWLVVDPGIYGPCRYDGERLHHLKLSKSPAEDAHRARYPDADFPPSGVYSIYKDRRGHMWFGTAAAGLCRYDGEVLSWMYEERLTTTPGGGAFGIRSIYQDRAGSFWICNTRQRFEVSPESTVEDGYNLIRYEKREGLPDARSDTDRNFTYYPSMTEDDAGALWMACGGEGVWKYDGTVTRHFIGDGVYAICVYRDRKGTLWLGTVEHGVYRFEDGSFKRFRPRGSSE
jgi:ligand-binding sensor domain-containing protein